MKPVVKLILSNLLAVCVYTVTYAQTNNINKAVKTNTDISAVMQKYWAYEEAGLDTKTALNKAVEGVADKASLLFTIGKMTTHGALDCGETYDRNTKEGQDSAKSAINSAYKEAKIAFLEGLKNKPQNGAQFCLAISILYESPLLNNNDSALYYVKKGLYDYPNSIAADTCAYKAGQYEYLVNNYKKSKYFKEAYISWAASYFNKDPMKTIALYSDYIEKYVDTLNPSQEDKYLWVYRGDFYSELGKHKEAKKDYELFLSKWDRVTSSTFDIYIRIAKMYEKEKAADSAKIYYQKAGDVYVNYFKNIKGKSTNKYSNQSHYLKPLEEAKNKYPDINF